MTRSRLPQALAALFAGALAALSALTTPALAQTQPELRGQWDRGGGGVELYDQPFFRGDRRFFGGPEGNLGYSTFNDQAQSVRIRDGRTWQFCDDANFRGRCVTLRGDEQDLNRVGLSRRISSFRPVEDGWSHDGGWQGGGGNSGWSGGQEIILYETDGFGGRSVRFRDSIPNLGFQNLNDATRSLRTRGRWVVCEDANYEGRCRTVEGELFSLDQIGMANRISSVRPAGRGDDDWGGGNDGWGPGHGGGADLGEAAQGRTATFFPRPRLNGAPAPACIGRDCGRAAAETFCRRAGFRDVGYFSVERGGRRGDVLSDVLCVR